MRIAIVSDIHDNLTAFEAVLADLRAVSPDLILHGGDLVLGGSHPAQVVDCIRDLGWPGVFGNTGRGNRPADGTGGVCGAILGAAAHRMW